MILSHCSCIKLVVLPISQKNHWPKVYQLHFVGPRQQRLIWGVLPCCFSGCSLFELSALWMGELIQSERYSIGGDGWTWLQENHKEMCNQRILLPSNFVCLCSSFVPKNLSLMNTSGQQRVTRVYPSAAILLYPSLFPSPLSIPRISFNPIPYTSIQPMVLFCLAEV